MKNYWDSETAEEYKQSDLSMRVYTSRLLGKSSDLVLHGGGNTSVKGSEKNLFGEEEEILYVKGSGWDLKTIEEPGFSACNLQAVMRLVELNELSDSQMVTELRKSLLNPKAPNPSVEAILHAVIPFKFVDHTHADAVVTLSNTMEGKELIKELYGEKSLILPYKMPGFILSKQVFEAVKSIDWNEIDSIILLHHGVFTFSNDAKTSYDNMINIVTKAENHLSKIEATKKIASQENVNDLLTPLEIVKFRKSCSELMRAPMLIKYKNNKDDIGFSNLNIEKIATRGPVTPDHVISTKRIPAILGTDHTESLERYSAEYKNYFDRNKQDGHICLDLVPRWAVTEGKGSLVIGPDHKRLNIISDIIDHTQKCIQSAEAINNWTALSEKDIFDLEYWELEQAKLKVGKKSLEMTGKVALVTGAASGIGKACAEELISKGCSVVALDINPKVLNMFNSQQAKGLQCDVTVTENIKNILKKTIYQFGGLDLIVSNAGSFPSSSMIEETDDNNWDSVLNLNLNSHFKLLRECTPYLKEGWEPSVVFVGSKNFAAPGPGVASYSVSKAGLAQLARVAALELGPFGIRVNTVHPNAVFDTGIWSDEVINKRAENYGLSAEEYKKNNILSTTIESKDVAGLVVNILGQSFSKTTGAQVPIDGGNERVI